MKTIQEQRDERRRSKLKHMQRQINAGRLVVRQMTEEELGGHPVFPRRVETREGEGPQ